MVKYIKYLIESYFNETDQLNNELKNIRKEENKNLKQSEQRENFLKTILGKITYNKYKNNGTFAPLPLSALHLDIDDFISLNPNVVDVDSKLLDKFIYNINKYYSNNKIVFTDNGYNKVIQTNIVFNRLSNIIDFFINIQKAYIKTYKDENINWKSFIKKFRNYLK